MGSSFGSLFPQAVLDCGSSTIDDARYDYECTASTQIRTGLTVLHLLVMAAVFTVAMILYVIYIRVLERKYRSSLLALRGAATTPFTPADAPRRIYKHIVAAYAMVAAEEALPRPLPSNLIDGAKGWGLPGSSGEGVHFKEAILGVAADLSHLVQEALLSTGTPYSPARLNTLRGLAPDLIRIFSLSAAMLWPVIITIEKAEHMSYEFTAEEFALFRGQVWAIMHSLRLIVDPAAALDPSGVRRLGAPVSHAAESSASLNTVAVTAASTDSIRNEKNVGFAIRPIRSTDFSASERPNASLPSPIGIIASRGNTPVAGEHDAESRVALHDDFSASSLPAHESLPLREAPGTTSSSPALHQQAAAGSRLTASSSDEGDFEDAHD
jgi:hypothetical protein